MADKSPLNGYMPAFPTRSEQPDGTVWVYHGLSVRDYFAAAVLASVYDRGGRYGAEGMQQVAEYAYSCADAMLTERDKVVA